MNVRNRVAEQLLTRLTVHVPLSSGAWNHSKVACHIEQLAMNEATGIKGIWQQTAEFTGQLRATLLANGADTLPLEALLTNLSTEPLMLQPDASIQVDELSEAARAILSECRDLVDENRLVPVLHFRVSGSLVRKLVVPQGVSDVYLGHAPDVGLAHLNDYEQIV